MNAFLGSIGYNGWILPALLAIPLIGTVLIWLQSAVAGGTRGRIDAAAVAVPTGEVVIVEGSEPGANGARQIAFWTLLIEFIVSVGLWWSFDPAAAGWQAVFDAPWIGTWN